jgi:hypothetical protein
MNGAYTATVRQLLDIAPVVFTTPHFAIKGGTALNLFLHDLPRLSVDIDVVFTDHSLGHEAALQAIAAELSAISLLANYFIKSTGRTNLHYIWQRFPFLPAAPDLQICTLALNCLTIHYADLWSECWDDSFQQQRWAKQDPRFSNQFFSNLTPTWQRDCALRSDYARRQALAEGASASAWKNWSPSTACSSR